MSEETKVAVEGAIRAHLADECEGAFLTDWVVFTAGAIPEYSDRTRYMAEYSDSPMHTLMGLSNMMRLNLEEQVTGDDDGDE